MHPGYRGRPNRWLSAASRTGVIAYYFPAFVSGQSYIDRLGFLLKSIRFITDNGVPWAGQKRQTQIIVWGGKGRRNINSTGITSSSCIVCYTRLYRDPATVASRLPSLPPLVASPREKKRASCLTEDTHICMYVLIANPRSNVQVQVQEPKGAASLKSHITLPIRLPQHSAKRRRRAKRCLLRVSISYIPPISYIPHSHTLTATVPLLWLGREEVVTDAVTLRQLSCGRCEGRGRIMDGYMDGWIYGWMDIWMDGYMDGWIYGWMDGWMLPGL
ncbi:hypothetical protein B0H65DRAFT_9289 [Neurospora tetraspora]|uniref:Uncharacterized protein n=1 Tax=Neurospora tetraspora TaxID=94610 RepID=A0AAE0MVE1_9PEZI|nr:hypothetical protein B0H65DRAFT_9289 [Neurospora tetraspora]